MFLVPSLHTALTMKHEDERETQRYMALKASLERFVTNIHLESTYLKILRPHSDRVWEIVNKRPRPSLRVFGLFASRDVFIATNLQLRSVLGAVGNPAWKQEIRLAVFEWRQLFHKEQVMPLDPLEGNLDQVISGAVRVK